LKRLDEHLRRRARYRLERVARRDRQTRIVERAQRTSFKREIRKSNRAFQRRMRAVGHCEIGIDVPRLLRRVGVKNAYVGIRLRAGTASCFVRTYRLGTGRYERNERNERE
jgi:hypothetical protein